MNTATVYYKGLSVTLSYSKPSRATHTDPPDSGEMYIDGVEYDDPDEWQEHWNDLAPDAEKRPDWPSDLGSWLRSRPSEMDALWKKVLA